MSFFTKIKDTLGIGGVKVLLLVPSQFPKADGVVNGKLNLTTKSDKTILSYEITLVEEYTTGRGDNKEEKEFELGRYICNEGFEIKVGETKEISFDLTYGLLKSNNDNLKEKGGALSTLGKVAAYADNEKSRYFIKATADVKGVALDPDDKREIQLV